MLPKHLRKTQFKSFYYIHIIEIPTNKGTNSISIISATVDDLFGDADDISSDEEAKKKGSDDEDRVKRGSDDDEEGKQRVRKE